MGVFENLHGLDHPRDLSEHLKAAAKKYFGTPIREFLRYIVKHRPDVSKMLAEAQVMLTQGHTGLNGEIYRVAKRFALVAVAGELATQAGVTSWPVGEATRGAHACFDGWLAERGLKPADSSAAVAQVRLYLEQYDSRFVTGDDKGITETHERAGFKRVIEADQVEYCIFEEVFKQRVCEGFDPKMVARALKDLGHLVSDSDHLTAKRTIPGADKVPTRLYVVRGSILAGDLEL